MLVVSGAKMMHTIVLTILLIVSVSQGGSSEFQPSFHDKSISSLSSLIKYTQRATANEINDSPQISSSIYVVGGTEAKPHQFPFQISLQVRNYFEGYDHNCGGVIIDDTHIVTACHCVRGYHHKNLKVVAGEHELFNDIGTEQYRDVEYYVFHPGYNPVTYENDIAIITLDHPLDLNDMVKPIALPSSVTEHSKTARTSGWGRTGSSDDDEQQRKLLYVDLSVYTPAECAEAYYGQISDGMMCAGDPAGGKGSCNGDSGGGLQCTDNNGTDYLCGIVSWGTIPCAIQGFPTVFTSINSYLDWLHALLPRQESSNHQSRNTFV